MKKCSSNWDSIFHRFGSHLGAIWPPIWEHLALLGELLASQNPKNGASRRTKMPLDPQVGAKKGFRSNFGWILNGFGSPDGSKTGPRRALNLPRTSPKPSPEPTQYSAFRMMHYPLPITPLPGPAGWAQPLNNQTKPIASRPVPQTFSNNSSLSENRFLCPLTLTP